MIIETTVREATEIDLPQIQQLYFDTINSINAADYNEDQVKAWSANYSNHHKWHARLAEQYFLVAARFDKVVGFTSITSQGYLDLLFVHKGYQRQGIAQQLLNAAIDYATQNQITRITSDVSITAKPFFLKNGFVIDKEQQVSVADIWFTNYHMSKALHQP